MTQKECIIYLGFDERYPDSFSFTYSDFILDISRSKKVLLIDRECQDPFEITDYNKYSYIPDTGCLKIWVNRFISTINHDEGVIQIFDDFYNNLKELRKRGVL